MDKADWDEESGKWNLDVTDLAQDRSFKDQCDVFINAGGILK